MRYFNLLNIQHFIMYLFPAFVTLVLIAVALAFSHFRREGDDARHKAITATYPGDIQEREAPFPLILILVIVGTVLWALGYIIGHGVLGVKI